MSHYGFDFGLVKFCKILYPYFRFRDKFFYSIEEIDSLFSSNNNITKQMREAYYSKHRMYPIWFSDSPTRGSFVYNFELIGTANIFSTVLKEIKDYPLANIRIKNYGNIFEVELNPKLSNFEFYRMVDPYNASVEISSFLSNIAREIKQPPQISDKDMASIKGFDKWSFRKEPSSKKRKKK